MPHPADEIKTFYQKQNRPASVLNCIFAFHRPAADSKPGKVLRTEFPEKREKKQKKRRQEEGIVPGIGKWHGGLGVSGKLCFFGGRISGVRSRWQVGRLTVPHFQLSKLPNI
jgi:hypothetical protein